MIHLPNELRTEYPFDSHYFSLKSGHKFHYVSEGEAHKDTIIMVHGNPTWSFFYRNLIKELSKNYRVIAVDHIGCGLSDKPQDYDYTLENHIDNLNELINSKVDKDSRLNLIVHDWGGAIGSGFALHHTDRLDKIVFMNTAAFTDIHIPKRISLCKLPLVGEPMVRGLNAFAWPATFMAVNKPLPKKIKKGYLFPYSNYKNRIATARFVKDIPMSESHPTWKILKNIENNLEKIKCDKLLLWGEKDFCFSLHFFKRWKTIFPEAQSILLSEAGHYLLEDEPDKTKQAIKKFFLN